MSGKFKVTIEKRSAVEVFGQKISTTYANAAKDCPKLWEDFCQKYFSCTTQAGCDSCVDTKKNDCSFATESYGISMMTSPGGFDYWVALPVQGNQACDMPKMTLPAGDYAVCECQSLEDIGPAYELLYMKHSEWLKSDMPYEINMASPCFERYPQDFMTVKRFYVCAPLKTKS